MREIGADNRETWLFGDLAGRDPDDAPGAIVYDKGYFFLRHWRRRSAARHGTASSTPTSPLTPSSR